MSYHDRSNSPEPKQRPKRAAAWTTKLLSNDQKTKLSIAARDAWAVQTKAGLVDGKFDDWRYTETEIACGTRSFRECRNTDFRPILAHFLRLAGKTAEAEEIWKKTGRVAGSNQIHDTHENRDVARAIIRDMVAGSNGKISQAYVMAIVANKHPGVSQENLTARDLQNLVFTLKARLRNK